MCTGWTTFYWNCNDACAINDGIIFLKWKYTLFLHRHAMPGRTISYPRYFDFNLLEFVTCTKDVNTRVSCYGLSLFVMWYSTSEIEVKISLKLTSFFFRRITRRTYPCKKESRRFCIYVNRASVDRACAISLLKNARCYECTLRTIRPSPSTLSLTTLAAKL